MDFLIHWPPGPVVATVQCQGLCYVRGHSNCYVTQWGVGGGVRFSVTKRYEGVRFSVITITWEWVGV